MAGCLFIKKQERTLRGSVRSCFYTLFFQGTIAIYFPFHNHPMEIHSMERLLHIETLFEAIHTSAGIHQLLLAGEERMAFGADFDFQLGFNGAGLKRFTANAANGGLDIFRMDFFFHAFSPLLRMLMGIKPQNVL